MADSLDARIGRNLRALRLQAGLDIDALALRAGLQPAAIGVYEAGRRRIPAEALTRISRALTRPLDAFFA